MGLSKEKHELTLALEKEKNKRLESEKRLETDRKNFDKLKLDFEARIDTFRNRNTDIEDELRREIATLQKLIETLRAQTPRSPRRQHRLQDDDRVGVRRSRQRRRQILQLYGRHVQASLRLTSRHVRATQTANN